MCYDDAVGSDRVKREEAPLSTSWLPAFSTGSTQMVPVHLTTCKWA
jgi:hypothetical protein